MYCLDCARAGAREGANAGPETVLLALQGLAGRGDSGARRLFFGIVWDEGRSILCYRCKRGRPVRLSREQVNALTVGSAARPGPSRSPTTAVGEKAAEGLPPPPLEPGASEGARRAA